MMMVLRCCGAHSGSMRAMQNTRTAHSASWREIRRAASASPSASGGEGAHGRLEGAHLRVREAHVDAGRGLPVRAQEGRGGSEIGCRCAKTGFAAASTLAISLGSSGDGGGGA